ncbi:TetR/AcrR family transcriptional regulator [Promicromonospora sp. NPDC052451]|uniref:TetR/AcrR family transcriptional regulator n=1 Tax=Promicromonospora sp. NPDC052451 TaxID=3364407 RepID=UPI0037C6431C
MRADAQRNYERIVSAASEAIAWHGAEASLEAIARSAGVGSATLHRHFPSRWSLLEAVFRDRVQALCTRAEELRAAPDALEALGSWLREVAAYSTTTRGLAASILNAPPEDGTSCATMLVAAGEPLRRRAVDQGSVRADVATADLLTLANAISLATQDAGAAEAERLVTLALEGVGPRSE